MRAAFLLPLLLLAGCALPAAPVQGRSVDRADCARARELLAAGGQQRAAPDLPGTGRQASVVLAPAGRPVSVPSGGSDLGVPDAEEPKLVVVGELSGLGLEAAREELRRALVADGWQVSDSGEGVSAGQLTSFGLRFQRAGASGSVGTVTCPDGPPLVHFTQLPAPGG
ncbi:hypothetical protein ABT324_27485 [Saccharopolyspora sp. NPDC000359]|uniref:hypothetical protein n=1 Tax=Saccharopolyspora sp. NPDC000359 TaxID=3154251 RepID=UPI00333019EF